MEYLRDKLGDHVVMMICKYVHKLCITELNKEYEESIDWDNEDILEPLMKIKGIYYNWRNLDKYLILRGMNIETEDMFWVEVNYKKIGRRKNIALENYDDFWGIIYLLPKKYFVSSGLLNMKGYKT